LVVVVDCLCASERLVSLRQHYLRLAQEHARERFIALVDREGNGCESVSELLSVKQDLNDRCDDLIGEASRPYEPPEMSAAESARLQRLAMYYAKMKNKYEWAANHPWLPVAPDAPVPD
jgi:hypothetical protein